VRILKTFNEMYGLFFKGVQNVRTTNIFNPNNNNYPKTTTPPPSLFPLKNLFHIFQTQE